MSSLCHHQKATPRSDLEITVVTEIPLNGNPRARESKTLRGWLFCCFFQALEGGHVNAIPEKKFSILVVEWRGTRDGVDFPSLSLPFIMLLLF